MIRRRRESELNLRHETTETLLLMSVLGQGDQKESALRELRRRKALLADGEFENSYITNLSGIC